MKFITKKNLLIGLMFIGVFIVGFVITYFSLRSSKAFNNKKVNSPMPTPAINQEIVNFAPPPEIVPQKGVYNSVLLGYGGAGHSGGLLTDSIIVVHVNTNKKTAALISIPRDLWVSGNRKINAEASINGFQNMGGVIKSVTGLPVNYFAAVDFSGFEKLINTLGGITVDVPKAFDDPFYPIAGLENETCGKTAEEIAELKTKYSDAQLEMQFTCRYERIRYDKGPANLDGTSALKFVRSRHGDSDFGRSARQFAVLKGILSKLISLKALSNTGGVINTISGMVKSNLNASQIKDLVEIIGDTGKYAVSEIQLTTDNLLNEGKSSEGAYILYPKAGMLNFDGIKSHIANNI